MANIITAASYQSGTQILRMMFYMLFYEGSYVIIAMVIAISHVQNNRNLRFLTSTYKVFRKKVRFQAWVSFPLLLKQKKINGFHYFRNIKLPLMLHVPKYDTNTTITFILAVNNDVHTVNYTSMSATKHNMEELN